MKKGIVGFITGVIVTCVYAKYIKEPIRPYVTKLKTKVVSKATNWLESDETSVEKDPDDADMHINE